MMSFLSSISWIYRPKSWSGWPAHRGSLRTRISTFMLPKLPTICSWKARLKGPSILPRSIESHSQTKLGLGRLTEQRSKLQIILDLKRTSKSFLSTSSLLFNLCLLQPNSFQHNCSVLFQLITNHHTQLIVYTH